MNYEELLNKAEADGLIVKEKPISGSDGRMYGNRIAIRYNIQTTKEKSCVLAEEIGHYKTTHGDITRINSVSDMKQEYRARIYGYNLKIGLIGIIKCYEYGCRTLHEMAEYLDVTEEYLSEAISAYRKKYGVCVPVDNYAVYFEPSLGVMKLE